MPRRVPFQLTPSPIRLRPLFRSRAARVPVILTAIAAMLWPGANTAGAQDLIDPAKIDAYRKLIPCDFNNDGVVTRQDADALISLIRFPDLREQALPDLTEEQLFILGDINNDALLDGRDHEAMLEILGGDQTHRSLDIPGPRHYDRPSGFPDLPSDEQAAANSDDAIAAFNSVSIEEVSTEPAAPSTADTPATSPQSTAADQPETPTEGNDEAAPGEAQAASSDPADTEEPLMGDLDEDGRISVYDVLLLAKAVRSDPPDNLAAEDGGTPVVQQTARIDFNSNGVAEVGDLEMWRNALFMPRRMYQPDPQIPRLQPGPGVNEPLASPAQIDSGFGVDATAIAKWNVVPHQVFAGELGIGVMAFHVTGIDRVEFSVNGGAWTPVTQKRWNPRTGVESYWVVLDSDDFKQREVEVRAVAYPRRGLPRELKTLQLTANYDGALRSPPVYVRSDGNDANPGTLLAPVRTMTRAFALVEDGGQIIMNRPGIYRMPNFQDVPWIKRPKLEPTRWITVRGAEGLSRRRLVVRQYQRSPLRPMLDKLRWRGISFNYHFITSYYLEDNQEVWFDTCRWFNSEGRGATYDHLMSSVRTQSGRDGAYVTDSLCEDMFYGFSSLAMVRNCQVRRIGGDAFTNSQMVVNARLEDQERPEAYADYHADVLQYFGDNENVIIYNVKATALHEIQGFMMNKGEFRNFAIINVLIDTVQEYERPPFSQFAALNQHFVVRNVMLPNQRVLMRTDFAPPEGYIGRDVLFEMCQFTQRTYNRLVQAPPPGVVFLGCFVAEQRGDSR